MKNRLAFFLAAGILLAAVSCETGEEPIRDIITFEELMPDSTGYWNGSDTVGFFKSGNATFPNSFTYWDGGFTSWYGFGWSTLTDVSTQGYENQYSCYAGEGADGSEVFAVISIGDTIVFKVPERVDRISLANTTYAALSMKNGDGFAKKFGGADGSDPDFFRLVIKGINIYEEVTGEISFDLADFTSNDPSEDYISEGWTEIPLDGLGYVKKLAFSFDSSDKGDWGINTPMYACIDNIDGVLQ